MNFDRARLESCAWVDTETQSLSFRAARLTACAFAAKTLLPQADFSDATLNQCNLRQMPLQRANFSRARLNNCDLSESRLNDADFRQANGSGSLFIRSDLSRANLRDANFIAAILQNACCRAPTCRAPICSGPTCRSRKWIRRPGSRAPIPPG